MQRKGRIREGRRRGVCIRGKSLTRNLGWGGRSSRGVEKVVTRQQRKEKKSNRKGGARLSGGVGLFLR